MKHLVIGQRQKAPNFSTFHWSPHGSLVSIGQHFVTMRVVHLSKRTETSLITEADLITESDQSVWAVHNCNSWFQSISCQNDFFAKIYFKLKQTTLRSQISANQSQGLQKTLKQSCGLWSTHQNRVALQNVKHYNNLEQRSIAYLFKTKVENNQVHK